MKHLTKLKALIVLALPCFMAACEKPIIEEEITETSKTSTTTKKGNNDAEPNVVIRVADFQLVPYTNEARQTRAVTDITEYCSRLNFVVYKDGAKVKSLSQLKGDSGYGEVSMLLSAGTYKLLVLAHSSKGNPTLASAEGVKFTNELGYSDTFYYYGDIEVSSTKTNHSLTLTRCSSQLQFVVNGNLPENVAKIFMYYSGGSGVFNAVTGYGGNVNSKQERHYNIEGLSTPITLPLFTFLQSDEGKLDLTVKALDANENLLLERTFTNIPMKRNMITNFAGEFFDSNQSFSFTAETDWAGTINETY